MRAAAVVFIVALLAAGCCRYPDLEPFQRMPLQTKIQVLRDAERDGCSPSANLTSYFWAVASHGAAARDAMLPWLRKDDRYFTRFDAIVVLRFAEADGVDLKPARALLERVAAEDGNADTRRAASDLAARIP